MRKIKSLYLSIIIISVIAVYGTGIAYGELVPKTLAKLYQEYQGKLIVRGQVMSVSENTAKNLTSYDIKILDYITRPQQASVITAVSDAKNKTIPVFDVGDNVQLYLDRGSSGYEIASYSFKMDKKCPSWFGPSHLDSEPIHGYPASNTRFRDSDGNAISPSLNHEFILATDGIYTPLDRVDYEILMMLNDNPNPIFHEIKQFSVLPCSYASPTWKFTPRETGNYTIYYKVIGGLYQNKIILDNASMTTGFIIEKSGIIQSSKNTANFIGNDLISPPLASPLKQFKSGISPKDVKCKDNFMLITKASNNLPACVTEQTYFKLVSRGWTILQKATTTAWVFENDTRYDIPYVIRGWNNDLSSSITFDPEHKSLIVPLKSVAEKGEITLTIPKTLLDSNPGLEFVVLVDGQETEHTEVISTTARMLTIPFEFGVQKIEIIAPNIGMTRSTEKNGTLSGSVVLAGGPRSGPQANYEVDVYATNGITIVGKTLSDGNGNYSIQLPAGNYTIYAQDYPTKQTHFVSVFSGKTTVFNIVYGTGYK